MREADFNLERIIPMAQRLSASGPQVPVPVRLDSGFDSADLMGVMEMRNRERATGLPQVDWLIEVESAQHPRGGAGATLDRRQLHAADGAYRARCAACCG